MRILHNSFFLPLAVCNGRGVVGGNANMPIRVCAFQFTFECDIARRRAKFVNVIGQRHNEFKLVRSLARPFNLSCSIADMY